MKLLSWLFSKKERKEKPTIYDLRKNIFISNGKLYPQLFMALLDENDKEFPQLPRAQILKIERYRDYFYYEALFETVIEGYGNVVKAALANSLTGPHDAPFFISPPIAFMPGVTLKVSNRIDIALPIVPLLHNQKLIAEP